MMDTPGGVTLMRDTIICLYKCRSLYSVHCIRMSKKKDGQCKAALDRSHLYIPTNFSLPKPPPSLPLLTHPLHLYLPTAFSTSLFTSPAFCFT